MAEYRLSKHVNAPPGIVFAVATDVENWSNSICGIERVELLTPGPVGVGSRIRETRKMFGRESVEELEFTAFEPPKRYVLSANSCGVRFESEHRFVPDISGTLVELAIRMQPLTIFAKLFAPIGKLMMGGMKKALEADLDDLKAAAESRVKIDALEGHAPPKNGYEFFGA